MADPLLILGATAAALQIASQAIELVKSVGEFYGRIKDAPRLTRARIMHLEQLINISKLIAKTPSLQTAEVQDVLVVCLLTVLKLRELLEKHSVEKLGRIEKTMNAVKLGKKEDAIMVLLATIEREKSLLALSIHQIDADKLESVNINITELQSSVDAASKISRLTARNVETMVEVLPDIADQVHGIYRDMPKLAAGLDAIQEHLRVTSISTTSGTEAPESQIYEVPNRRVHEFVGRESILAQIEERFNLKSEKEPRIVVLRAMGGQGKTQIALEYCRRAKDRTGTAVLWVDASSESTLMQSYSSFSESFASLEGVPQDVNARVKFTIRKLRAWQNPWLIVFDNYDSPAEFNNVEDYMPENDKGMILITTRHADADRLAVEDDQIQLPGLSESEAVELLLKQSQRKLMSDSSLNSGRMIVSRLGYHALAIAQAGAYINKRKLPLEEFLNHFERRKDTILKDTTPQMSQYRRKLGQAEKETSLSVFTTWELSYRQLFAEDTEDKCVADLLTLFAFFDPSGISEGLFRAYCDNPRKTETASDDSGSSNATLDDQEPACSQRFFDGNEYQVPGAFLALHEERWDSDYYCDALAIMAQLSLVEGFTRTSDGLHKVTLHPLVRDWIRLRTQKSSCAAYTYLAATCIDRLLLSRRIKDFFMIDWSTIQELLSHLEAYMKNLEDFFPQHSALLYRYKRFHFEEYDLDFGDLYLQSGQYGKGKEIYKRCLARRENKDAANDSITRVIFRRLSNAHSYLGEYKEAEDLARKGLNSVLEAKGIENAETFDQMNLLVATLLNQDLNEEAEELIRTSLKLREKLHGTDDYNIAHSLANLGRIYYRQQKYMEAEEIFRQALSLQEALLGKEHRATRNTMHNVANCLNVLGGAENWKGAEELYHLILETGERTLGKDHPQQIYTQLNLAKLLVKMDRNEEAEEIYNRAMKLLEVSLGKSHPRTLDCATNYGALLCVTGRYEDALPLLERAFEETRELLGLEHPKTIYREMRLKDLLKEMAYHTNSIR